MLLVLAWRNIWRNKKRSGITLASILFAVLFAVFTRSMQFGTYESMIENVVGLYTGYVQIHQKGYWDEKSLDLSMDLGKMPLEKIRNLPRVKKAAPRLEGFVLISNGTSSRGGLFVGMDPTRETRGLLSPKNLSGKTALQLDDRGIVIGAGLADYLKAKKGDSLVLLGQGFHGISAAAQYPVLDVLDLKSPTLNDGFLFAPLPLVQEFFSAENRVTALSLDLTDPDLLRSNLSRLNTVPPVVENIQNLLDPNEYEVMGWQEMMPELVQSIQADSAGGIIMIAVLYLIIIFGIFGTIVMMTAERRFEFGVLLSMGMARGKLMGVMLMEILMLAAMGAAAGSLAVWPIVYFFNKHPIRLTGQAAEAMKNYGLEAVIPTTLDPGIFITHALILMGASCLLYLYPLWKLKTLRPVEAMRP